MASAPARKKRRLWTLEDATDTTPELPKTAPCPDSYYGYQDIARLRDSMVQAAITGRVDFIRAVLDDPDLVQAITHGWSCVNNCASGSRCACQRRSPANLLVSCSKFSGFRVPLLVHACDHGHLDVVKELVERGADINLAVQPHMYGRHPEFAPRDPHVELTPLSAACRGGFGDVAEYLIVEQNAILTPIETSVKEHRGRRCDYYGKTASLTTPLTEAADTAMDSTVQLLIRRGVLNTTSVETNPSKYAAKQLAKLVGYSVREALNSAWNSVWLTNFAENEDLVGHSRILELLGQSGVSVYSLYQDCKKEEREISQEENEFEQKLRRSQHRDPFPKNRKPECHVLALIRALRHVSVDCLKDAGVTLPETTVERLIDLDWKKKYWDAEVQWIEKEHFGETKSWLRPFADLILSAAKPWSRHNHYLFPEAVRHRAYAVFLVGTQLGQKSDMDGAIADI